MVASATIGHSFMMIRLLADPPSAGRFARWAFRSDCFQVDSAAGFLASASSSGDPFPGLDPVARSPSSAVTVAGAAPASNRLPVRYLVSSPERLVPAPQHQRSP